MYFTHKKEELHLDVSQVCLVFLDVWRVHISKEFLIWVKQTYDYIKLAFIPPGKLIYSLVLYLFILGCTGVAQVCDLVVNKPIKDRIRTGLIECIYFLIFAM